MAGIFSGIITRQAIRRATFTFTSAKDLSTAIYRRLQRPLSAIRLGQRRRRIAQHNQTIKN